MSTSLFFYYQHLLIQTRYETIEPSKISKGDIVEAQVSLMVIPVKNKKYKPLLILRAITLIDSQPTKVKFIDQEIK